MIELDQFLQTREVIMKTRKILLSLACFTGCFCLTNGTLYAGHKTPGEKLDKAIDTTKEKANDAKEAAKNKYDETKQAAKETYSDAKEAIKEKSDEAREKIADKIRPPKR
jgi:hypothetical protein